MKNETIAKYGLKKFKSDHKCLWPDDDCEKCEGYVAADIMLTYAPAMEYGMDRTWRKDLRVPTCWEIN